MGTLVETDRGTFQPLFASAVIRRPGCPGRISANLQFPPLSRLSASREQPSVADKCAGSCRRLLQRGGLSRDREVVDEMPRGLGRQAWSNISCASSGFQRDPAREHHQDRLSPNPSQAAARVPSELPWLLASHVVWGMTVDAIVSRPVALDPFAPPPHSPSYGPGV
jgi:hypothetical protein